MNSKVKMDLVKEPEVPVIKTGVACNVLGHGLSDTPSARWIASRRTFMTRSDHLTMITHLHISGQRSLGQNSEVHFDAIGSTRKCFPSAVRRMQQSRVREGPQKRRSPLNGIPANLSRAPGGQFGH